MTTITPHLWFDGNCAEAVDFYGKALGASLVGEVIPSPDGGVWHAMLQLGDSKMMMADTMAGSWEAGPDARTTVGFWIYVDDCDAAFDQAVAAGCEVIHPVEDMFWGDRTGKVKDPFGHAWAFATHKWVYSEEEMAAARGS